MAMKQYFFWMKFDPTTKAGAAAAPEGSSASILGTVTMGGTIRNALSAPPASGGTVVLGGTIRNGKRPDGTFESFAGTIRQRAEATGNISFNLLTHDGFSFFIESEGADARLFPDAQSAWGAVQDPLWQKWSGNGTLPVILTSIDIETP